MGLRLKDLGNRSPGDAGVGPVDVVIGEVLARTDTPVTESDSIELLNASGSEINISGWFFRDSSGVPRRRFELAQQNQP